MICDMSQTHATLSGRTDEMISAAVRGLIAQRRRDLKPAQVAIAIGVSRAALYRKLGNDSPWQAEEVDRLARFFEVSRDSLYEGRADFASAPAGNVTGLGARSSTDRASDYGSALGLFSPFRQPRRRRSDRHRTMHVVPLTLVEDGQAAS